MKPVHYAVIALLAAVQWAALPFAQAQTEDPILFGSPIETSFQLYGHSTPPPDVLSQVNCPRYGLAPRYYGWIYFEGDVPGGEDPWTFQPGDPVEVAEYEGAGMEAMALLRIDMKRYTEVRVTVYYTTDPVGWVTNLGDSRTNNGCCGDAATSTFDAELWVIQPPAPPHDPPWFEYDVGVCTNIFGGGVAQELGGLLAEEGPTALTFVIRDQYLRISSDSSPLSVEFTGPGMFRIDEGIWDDEASGCNDGVLWLGLNRVVSSTARSGQGVILAEVELLGLYDWVPNDKNGAVLPLDPDSACATIVFDIP